MSQKWYIFVELIGHYTHQNLFFRIKNCPTVVSHQPALKSRGGVCLLVAVAPVYDFYVTIFAILVPADIRTSLPHSFHFVVVYCVRTSVPLVATRDVVRAMPAYTATLEVLFGGIEVKEKCSHTK